MGTKHYTESEYQRRALALYEDTMRSELAEQGITSATLRDMVGASFRLSDGDVDTIVGVGVRYVTYDNVWPCGYVMRRRQTIAHFMRHLHVNNAVRSS